MVRYATIVLAVVFSLIAIPTGRLSAQDYVDPVERALADFEWESVAADGVQALYKAGSFAERHRHMLLRSARVALDEVLDCLGEGSYDRLLRLFYVESRQEMEELVGRPVTGLAVWTGSGVFLVVNPEWRSFEKHEITHVVTMGAWDNPHPSSQWMVEGISIACDGWCREYNVDEIASHLLENGELPPLSEMLEDVRSLGEVRGGVYAASVIGFIRKTYGTGTVRSLWVDGTLDLDQVLGATAEEIEALWKTYLEKSVSDDVEVDYGTIEELGCG